MRKFMIDFEALFRISYGLYLVCSGDKDKGNGYVSNTVFQVTSEPPRFAVSCNKSNYTSDLIIKSKAFSVSVLDQNVSSDIIGLFGYKSGRDVDKLTGLKVQYGETGVPVVLNECVAYLEFRLLETIDAGTHLIFIGELLNSVLLDKAKEPLTYSYYRLVKKGVAPKNAPTYIDKSKYYNQQSDNTAKRYKCPACGYIYDEAIEKVKFSELPDDWVCPVCGTEKSDFIEV